MPTAFDLTPEQMARYRAGALRRREQEQAEMSSHQSMLKMTTKIVSISDLRRQTNRVIQAAQEENNVVYITQYGRLAAVLLDYEYYEALLAQLEDLSDLATLEAAVTEPEREYKAFLAEKI